LTLARNAQKEFLIGQISRSHATYRDADHLWMASSLVNLRTKEQPKCV